MLHRSFVCLTLLAGACDLPGEIGSDIPSPSEDASSPDDLEPCVSDCEDPAALQWTTHVSLRRGAILAHKSGEVVLFGQPLPGVAGGAEMALVRLDADGRHVATQGLPLADAWNLDLVETSDGNLAATAAYNDVYAAKLTLDGTVLWTFDPDELYGLYSVAATPDGGVFLGGSRETTLENATPWLARLDTDGNPVWIREGWPVAGDVPLDDSELVGEVVDLAIDQDGDILALGSATVPSPWVAKFDAESGDELWSTRYDEYIGPGALTVDGAGGFVMSAYGGALAARPGADPIWRLPQSVYFEEFTRPEAGLVGAVGYHVNNNVGDVITYHAVDPGDGAILWTHAIQARGLGGVQHSVDARDGRVYAVFAENGMTVMAIRI